MRTLCGPCNNLCGRWYVPEHACWVDAGVRLLRSTPGSYRLVPLELPGAHPQRFVKQVAACS